MLVELVEIVRPLPDDIAVIGPPLFDLCGIHCRLSVGETTPTVCVFYDVVVTATVARPSWLSPDRFRTTPARLRTWSVVITALLSVAAVFASFATQAFISSVDKVERNTGPVLISTQRLVGSIAEADAANTAVFLSGTELDRQQQSLFENAISRAPQQLEDVSTGIGDDPESHEALKRVASQLPEYARLAERARLANLAGDPSATADLQRAFELVSGPNGMIDNTRIVTSRTQSGFDDDLKSGNLEWVGAIVALAVTLLVLLLAQRNLRARTRRTFNLPLVLATFCVIGLGIWLSLALLGRQQDLQSAQTEAYDSIALTAKLQTLAFEYKTAEALSIIEEDASDFPTNGAAIKTQLKLLLDSADSDREEGAVGLLQARWDRYETTSQKVESALTANGSTAARRLAISEGNADFNGFNTTVESVLLANRDQFNDAVASAGHRMRWLRLGAILLPLLAALLTLAGYQLRINEYW